MATLFVNRYMKKIRTRQIENGFPAPRGGPEIPRGGPVAPRGERIGPRGEWPARRGEWLISWGGLSIPWGGCAAPGGGWVAPGMDGSPRGADGSPRGANRRHVGFISVTTHLHTGHYLRIMLIQPSHGWMILQDLAPASRPTLEGRLLARSSLTSRWTGVPPHGGDQPPACPIPGVGFAGPGPSACCVSEPASTRRKGPGTCRVPSRANFLGLSRSAMLQRWRYQRNRSEASPVLPS
jgi:hypothetical protein